jgi:putative heme-binding domain-containing protein
MLNAKLDPENLMRIILICGAFLFATTIACLWDRPSQSAQDPYGGFVAKTNPRTPAEEQKCFHLPPGFEIQLVVSEPEVIKPINMNFDDRGRLWVTQSVEYPFPVSAGRKPRDTIKILEATDGDGVADKVTTFADGLNIPIGIIPIKKGAIAYSIPNIYRFLDTKGDDHADRRELLYGSIGFEDTHGMTSSFTWGFDGWIYACHGFANTSELKAADGSKIKMQSGNTYRMKPDGSRVEQFTHGQVNPFGLCFDPLGNLYSADCHTRPVMMLLRGGYYDSFGKPHDGLGYAPEMCPNYERSTAVAGIVYYAADQFPPAYRDTLFFGDVVTNEVNQYHLERHGSTLKAILQPKFLTCDDPWFRPVDIKLGLDGALYIADFYNRIIGHYEVPLTHPGRDHERGRIWRIVYRGADGKGKAVQPRPDWGQATIQQLVEDLAHPNLAIRLSATNQLVERGGPETVAAVQAVMQPQAAPFQWMHGLWVLERLHALDESRLFAACADKEPGVRVHALRVLAERRVLSDREQALARERLRDPDGFVQRAATEVASAHPSVDNVRALLLERQGVAADDTHLLYAVRMALRDQLRQPEIWAKLPALALSSQYIDYVADVAPGAHTPEAAGFLLSYLKTRRPWRDTQHAYLHHIARYGSETTNKELLELARQDAPTDLRHQAAHFKAIQQGTQERGTQLTGDARQWGEKLAAQLLASQSAEDGVAGAELAGALQAKSVVDSLTKMAGQRKLAEAPRRAALDALIAIDLKGQTQFLERILGDASEEMGLRERAVEVLAGLNQPEAYNALLKALEVAPARLQHSIADRLANSEQGAQRLVSAVAAGKASARLLQEHWINMRLDKYSNLKAEVAKLTHGLPTADERLQKLLQERRTKFSAAKTDAGQGAKVFEKSCAICHQLGGKGAKVGPQLDGVGNRGLDRLLEDIIDPNRNVDQAFRATTLALKNGQVLTGLVLREEGEVAVLADAQGKEVRIPKNTIEERSVSQMSPMPANLVDQIPEADFYHLLAYLLSLRSREYQGR